MIPLEMRKGLIETSDNQMSICKQCELLNVSRSTLYYTPSKASDKDLEIMQKLDMLYLEDPTRGTRRMARELRKLGYGTGMVIGYQLHFDAQRIYVLVGNHGCLQSFYCWLELVKHHGIRMGGEYFKSIYSSIWQA